MKRRPWRRWARRLALVVLPLLLLAAAPVVVVEQRCVAESTDRAPPAPRYDLGGAEWRRAAGDSFLTYPEWFIVHAYEDMAGVARQASESSFDYLASIAGFWRSLCNATREAARTGAATADQKTTNYVIGISFTAEMAVIGAYERTIGALTAWARGPRRTPEDEFALRVAEDYSTFLRQVPWYEYPFATELSRLWEETPYGEVSVIRSTERRAWLSALYGGRAAYAVAIGALAGAAPAALRIRSVIMGGDPEADPRITILRRFDDGATLIETPRYRALTQILAGIAQRGGEVREIAGNPRILVTVLAPDGVALPGDPVFALPIQSRPGWRRLGLDVTPPDLTRLMRDAAAAGASFEHAYDY
jgi:hypothetical protein